MKKFFATIKGITGKIQKIPTNTAHPLYVNVGNKYVSVGINLFGSRMGSNKEYSS
jgi:hypothetical protein